MLDSLLEFPNDFAVGVAAVVAIRRRCWDKVDDNNAVLAKCLIYIMYGMVLKLFCYRGLCKPYWCMQLSCIAFSFLCVLIPVEQLFDREERTEIVCLSSVTYSKKHHHQNLTASHFT